MAATLDINTKGFAKWAAVEIKEFKKDAATLLNSAAGDVAAKAVKHTVKATQRDINQMVGSKGNPSRYVYSILEYYSKHGSMPPWAYGIMPSKLVGNVGPKGSGMRTAAAIAYMKAKRSSSAYIAVGWIEVAKFFGKVMTTKISKTGWAAHSTGEKATPQKLTATLMNYSRGADKCPGINQAIQKSMDEVVKSMAAHVKKKMEARAKVSP